MEQTMVEQPVPSPIRPLSRDRGRRKGEMLAGPIERDFSISRPPFLAAEQKHSGQTTKEKFPKPSSLPRVRRPNHPEESGGVAMGAGAPFSPFRGLMLYGALSFASVHFRQPLRPVAVCEMNDWFR